MTPVTVPKPQELIIATLRDLELLVRGGSLAFDAYDDPDLVERFNDAMKAVGALAMIRKRRRTQTHSNPVKTKNKRP
jgi:hypothetical protein